MTPASFFIAMVTVVEFTLKAVQHVEHLGKTGFFQRVACIERAVTAAADHDDWSVNTGGLFDVTDEVRIDFPVRAVVPGHMYGAYRMPDKKVFHFAAAIDEYRVRVFLQKVVSSFGFEMFHGRHVGQSGIVKAHYKRSIGTGQIGRGHAKAMINFALFHAATAPLSASRSS